MADARANLKQVADEELTTERWRTYLAEVAEVEKKFRCFNCGRPNTVKVVNVDGLVKLLDATGKPPEARTVDVYHHDDGRLDAAALAELTDAELVAIGSGQTVQEGDWTELAASELSPPA